MTLNSLDIGTVGPFIGAAWKKQLNTGEDPANGRWYVNGANGDAIGLYGGLSDAVPTGLVFNDSAMIDAAWMSLRVGATSATLATLLGTLAAVALARGAGFKGRTLFSGMLYAPLVMPEVITGLSLLLLFVAINAERGF